jgi:hypothetical protein
VLPFFLQLAYLRAELCKFTIPAFFFHCYHLKILVCQQFQASNVTFYTSEHSTTVSIPIVVPAYFGIANCLSKPSLPTYYNIQIMCQLNTKKIQKLLPQLTCSRNNQSRSFVWAHLVTCRLFYLPRSLLPSSSSARMLSGYSSASFQAFSHC